MRNILSQIWYPPWVKDSLLKYPQKMAAFFPRHWSSQVQQECAGHWQQIKDKSIQVEVA